jgi:hypothetical protein
MGQVFTWGAVRTGRIPKPGSFNRVAELMRGTLAREPSVVSALLFGSVIRGDSNVRSDIDCVVLYEKCEQRHAMRTMHRLDCAAAKMYVPINFTPCDTVLATTRLHHLGSSFVRHLHASIDAGGLIKGDLVPALAVTIPVEQEIENYITAKMYNMQESYAQMATFSEERLASFLKKSLEAPTHIARKMLIYEGQLRGDSKRQVQEQYGNVMPAALADQFDALLATDCLYTHELEKQRRRANRQRYARIIRHLISEVPRTLEFIRSNILRLHNGSR